MGQPRLLVALAGTSAVLTIAGPFDTDEHLRLAARAGYWTTLVFATYAWGLWVHAAFEPGLLRRNRALRVAILTAITGFGVALIVLALNFALFGIVPRGADWFSFLATLFAITGIVVLGLDLAGQMQADPATAPPSQMPTAADTPVLTTPDTGPETGPALLARLPMDKRGAILSLSVEDHYTRVRTTGGETLLLLRLTDAIRETDGMAGARVHRSHWVAFAHVTAARRTGDRALLTLSDGSEIPVSRANLPIIKEAGLLPR